MLFKEQRIVDLSVPGQWKETIMPAKEVQSRIVRRWMDRNLSATVYLQRFTPKPDKWSMYVAIQKAIRPSKPVIQIQGDNAQRNNTQFDLSPIRAENEISGSSSQTS